jgi:inosose dehydratase
MRSLGLDSTELGAPGFLPDEPKALAAVLEDHGMTLVGGFVPLVLHDRDVREEALAQAEATARLFATCGGDRFVTAAVMDQEWSEPVRLDDAQLATLADGLAAVDEICDRHGLVQALHPHVGCVVETQEDVERVLAVSDVRWCLDTGHLAIGGFDPVRFAREAGDRVAHVHLKDVDLSIAERVATRKTSLLNAVQEGLFTVLGTGDIAVDEVVRELDRSGYTGRYVLEQDIAITTEPPAPGTGPVDDVRACLAYLTERLEMS